MDKVKILSLALLISLVLNGVYLFQGVREIRGNDYETVAVESPGIENLVFDEKSSSVKIRFKSDMNQEKPPLELFPPVKFESK